MAARNDLENGSTPEEREPLLGPQQAGDNVVASSAEEDVTSKYRSEASKRREYGWRGFWIVVVILIIAAFVKGWIEADDIDVSLLLGRMATRKQVLTNTSSSTSRVR